jgi:tetratricopeptide (TPR) repeat protein
MMRLALATALLAALAVTPATRAQQAGDEIPADVQALVRDGQGAALEAKLSGARRPLDLELLARAYTNQARRERRSEDRDQAFNKAADFYGQWRAALERDATLPAAKREVSLAAARAMYGTAIVGVWADADLNEYELTGGRRGDRARLLDKLKLAREEFDGAAARLDPLVRDLSAREDEFLALGIDDQIRTLRLDITLTRSWVNYYIGLLETDEATRTAALQAAQAGFRELIDSAYVGRMIYRCFLGLGVSLRELRQFDEAVRALNNVPRYGAAAAAADGEDPADGVDISLQVQVRCELARLLLAQGKFEEARAELAPLAERDLDTLRNEERPATFYFNLAVILDAASYLQEAEQIRAQAEGHRSARSLLANAERIRARGVGKFQRLALRGGGWNAIAQVYIVSSLARDADPTTLSPADLLYVARDMLARDELAPALERLREAAGRSDLEPALAGDILFELGTAQYKTDDWRSAAETFARLAGEFRSHDKASQAAAFAYQLWAKLAEESKAPADYQKLADVLLNLLQSYPQHPNRPEAAWWLPVALQAAGKLDDAAAEFAKIPESSPHWEEAQFRRALCARLAVEQKRGELTPDEFRQQAGAAADLLRQYGRDASERAAAGGAKATAKTWAAQAEVAAAELLAAQGVDRFEDARAVVDGFEERYPDSDLVGRVLGVRIRAYRGLRQFEQAAQILDQYLQSVPAERAGAVLAVLASGMEEEVARLADGGQADAARELAKEAIVTFEQLARWCAADPARAANARVVRLGLARMQYQAGEHAAALETARGLLADDPRNGQYQRVLAQALTAQLGDSADAAAVTAAQAAWGELLKDSALRQRAPQVFWEAQYNYLALLLRSGDAGTVKQAIRQQSIWFPDLGGPPWQERLRQLLTEAETRAPDPAAETPPDAAPPG